MKKEIDIITKGWSEETIRQLAKIVESEGVKFQVEIKLKDGSPKWIYSKNPDDVKPYCEKIGATIIKIEPFP